MTIQWTKNTITVHSPGGAGYEVEVEIGWKLIAKGYPARINYTESDHPAEPPEYEIQGVTLTGHTHYG